MKQKYHQVYYSYDDHIPCVMEKTGYFWLTDYSEQCMINSSDTVG